MKLYYAQNSRAVRVAWLLEELGLPYDYENFTIGDKSLRAPDYLSIHPLGRVPVLQDGDVRLYESGAIIQYILAKYGSGKLQPEVRDINFSQFLQWFHYAEGMIMPPMNTIVVETVLLPAERRNEVNVKRATKLLGQMLKVVDSRLTKRKYLVDEFSAADIMSGHATIMAQHHGVDFSDKPNLISYISRLLERPALKKAWSL